MAATYGIPSYIWVPEYSGGQHIQWSRLNINEDTF